MEGGDLLPLDNDSSCLESVGLKLAESGFWRIAQSKGYSETVMDHWQKKKKTSR